MTKAKWPIPDGYHTLTPHMVLMGAGREFMKQTSSCSKQPGSPIL